MLNKKRDPLLVITALVMVVMALTGVKPGSASGAERAGDGRLSLTLSLTTVTPGSPEGTGPATRVPDPGDPDPKLKRCRGKYRLMASHWNQRTVVAEYVLLPRPHTELRRIAHAVNAEYWQCPGFEAPHRVQVTALDYCHFMVQRGRDWDGTWYNPYIYDDSDKDVNPPRFLLGEGRRADEYQKCGRQIVPAGDREWMRMSWDPRWNIRSKNRREGVLPDESWVNWRVNRRVEVMDIHPAVDIKLTDWFYPPRPW